MRLPQSSEARLSRAPDGGYRLADLADDAQGVIDALKLDRYVVVGHSMGGKTAQLLAARRPMGLRGLVLVAPSPPSPTVLPQDQREALLHAHDSPESIAYVRDHILTALPHIAAARLQVLPGAGHLSMLEAPRALAQAIAQFVANSLRKHAQELAATEPPPHA